MMYTFELKVPKKKTLFCHNSETFDCASTVPLSSYPQFHKQV
jgi:hypothetical protein